MPRLLKITLSGEIFKPLEGGPVLESRSGTAREREVSWQHHRHHRFETGTVRKCHQPVLVVNAFRTLLTD